MLTVVHIIQQLDSAVELHGILRVLRNPSRGIPGVGLHRGELLRRDYDQWIRHLARLMHMSLPIVPVSRDGPANASRLRINEVLNDNDCRCVLLHTVSPGAEALK